MIWIAISHGDLIMDNIEQRTDEWITLRLGKVTASRVKDVIAKTKSGYSASRKNYAAQLIVERMTGQRQESYANAAMQWGTDHEPEAREMYEMFHTGVVEEVGFISHPVISNSGASPDGLIGDTGMIEIKCPNTATHIEWLLGGKAPAEHIPQMAWQMACAGRSWCDFVSYDPRMPEHLQLFVVRYHRDESLIANLETEVVKFLSEVDEIVLQLGALDHV